LNLLNNLVDMAGEVVSLRRDRKLLRQQLDERYGVENIVGRSSPMMEVFKKIRQVAPTDATVLINGETGTGKELVARAIHYNSNRKSQRFVPVNCAGIVESILESELFGHEKGAFTNADSSRVGLFEYADHGTLFLDEVGDLSQSSQSKLLRVLEEDEVVRVGSNEPIHVDVRVLAATNQDLRQKVKDGQFREDLYYRLNVVRIALPPLRERQGDIMRLIRHFASQMSEEHGKEVRGLSPGARKALLRYRWPGNVRELKNTIEHMVVVSEDEVLGEDDLPDYIRDEAEERPPSPSLNSLAGLPLEEVEKRHIARTLDLVDGNRQKAAELLGIGERTLYRKIQKYDLS
ncbi:MAG: sigma-54 dependent transcriptional regulator, partial [Planctomycetota bacterium]